MTIDLKQLGTTIGTCVAICTGIWFFAQPAIDTHINEVISTHLDSNAYKVQHKEEMSKVFQDVLDKYTASKEFDNKIDAYLNRVNSNSVSLRHLLSIKMGIPEESVADELSDLYNKDSKWLRNVLRELNRMYPELNIWSLN